ncbi:response regulator transcription factor [Thiospirochaeta perfilievii]|uniref:Response regulator transcription factor n=1 Tax=Thiospirochaeta perfilievii TaxID=252967 RepID=A0A5C1QBN1_9SPIO|nr:response regulator transcription factor [Thiospirochaeta perfilievii]QEN04798.1 response regulator transcription factor [Thiospirochaeta perfilievii]
MAHEIILVIDDDDDLREFTVTSLKTEGFKTIEARNGNEAIFKAKNQEIDLVLLDLNLPDIDGEDVLQDLKSLNKLLPIIVLSGKQSVSSKVLTLGFGADDYVTKPFSEDELIARIKANIKKYSMFNEISESKKSDFLNLGNISLDQRNFIVKIEDREEKLSPRLFSLLRFFMENPDVVFNKRDIYSKVWDDNLFDDNTVTVFIRKLRRIIELDPGKPKHLLTIWGEGYKFIPSEK